MGRDLGATDYSYYPDGMHPVPFPAGTGATAEEVCRRVAGLLDTHLLERPAMVESARDGWEGTYRTEFDETWATQETGLTGLKEDLQLLAGAIATARANAATLDEARALQRADYARERTAPAPAPAPAPAVGG